MNLVPDIIDYRLSILFIGFNPGIRSSETGHHFAGPSNRFWRLLYEAGLTDKKLSPADDAELLQYGYGITNIIDRPSRSAAELTAEEYTLGRDILKQKLTTYRPLIACYAGIGVYQRFAQQQHIVCGLQDDSVVTGIADFVVSSPSGLNRIPLQEQLNYYVQLRQLVKAKTQLFSANNILKTKK